MKNLLRFACRLLLTFIASAFVSFISMMLFLSSDIAMVYKVLLGALFIVFVLFLAGNSAMNQGIEDTRAKAFVSWRGFAAGFFAMIPSLVLTLVYLLISFRGWDGAHKTAADILYLILYVSFSCFSPLLSCLVSFNPALSVDIAQPAISFIKNIATPNAVSGPLFLLPIATFILASGIGYLFGHNEQNKIQDALKKVKKSR